MTASQIHIVQKTWKLIAATDGSAAGAALYHRLADIIPALRSNTSGAGVDENTAGKTSSVISYIVRKLHQRELVLNEVEDITRRYIHDDLCDEQYIQAGKSLLQVLSSGLGEQWDDDTEYAWAVCFTTLAETIMNVSRNCRQEAIYYC